MAVTRKLLKGMGLTDEQVDTIIDAHTEVVDGLKEQISTYKADAEALPGVRKELEEAQADLAAEKKDSWKVKYEGLKEDFDNYKESQSKKETHASKETAFRDLLKQAGVAEKHINSVLKVSDVDAIELDDDGKVKNAGSQLESIKKEWSDFIQTTGTQGANTSNPPANNGGTTMTKDEIMKIRDPGKRQEAIAKNIELFENNNSGKDD